MPALTFFPAIVFLCAAVSVVATCATTGSPNAAKYPPRPATCKLVVFNSPKPGVLAWDDLGVAEASCHLDLGQNHCFQQLRAAACRMGGDVIYDVPKRALRPTEQGMLYRARVAHTRAAKREELEPAKDGGPPPPPPASAEESTGPVIPLGAVVPPPPVAPRAVDGGAAGDADGAHP